MLVFLETRLQSASYTVLSFSETGYFSVELPKMAQPLVFTTFDNIFIFTKNSNIFKLYSYMVFSAVLCDLFSNYCIPLDCF